MIFEELNEKHNHVQYCNLLAQLTSIDVSKISHDKFLEHLRLIKSNPNHKIIVAKIDNIIVGTVTILIEPKFIHNLSYIAHIEDVVVDSAQRRSGIGAKLMEKAIIIAKINNCYKIILNTAEKNIPFYEKFGFVQKEKQMVLYF